MTTATRVSARRMMTVVVPLGIVAAGALLVTYGYVRDSEMEALRIDLFTTVRIGSADDVKALLDRGADPNARETAGDEPAGMLERLKGLFVRPKAARDGDSLLCVACTNQRHGLEIVKQLAAHGVRMDQPGLVTAAAYNEDPALLRYVIDHGADVTSGEALFWPARGGNLAEVRLLVEHGADVNRRNSAGYTPLDGAVLANSSQTVRYLVGHGALVRLSLVGSSRLPAMGMGPFGPVNKTMMRILHDAKEEQAKL